MADITAGTTPSATPTFFQRKATGLVRQVTMWDAFWMNSIGGALGLGVAFMFYQGPALFPGGNPVVATLIATVVCAFTFIYVYARFSAAMPRSGGDYVFVSRALHPILGWLLAFSQGAWLIFFWVGFNGWFLASGILPVPLNTLSVVLNAPFLSQWALAVSSTPGIIIIGSLNVAVFVAILLLGGRVYWRFQKVLVALCYGSLALCALLLLLQGGSFASHWDEFVRSSKQGIPYAQVIPAAMKAGFNFTGGFNWVATLEMFPFAFFVVGFFQGSAQIGGEVRQGGNTQFFAMVIACLVNGLALAVLGQLLINAASMQWLAALGYLSLNQPAVLHLSSTPYYEFLAGILTTNPLLLLLIGLGYAAWALGPTPLSMLQATRYMVAWSVDGLAPAKLGEVGERFHTPTWALVLCLAAGIFTVVLLTFYSIAFLLGSLLAQVVAYMLVAAAAVVFPYRLRSLYQSSGERSILGIPVVTLAGAAGFLFLCYLFYLYFTQPAFGQNQPLAMKFTAGGFVIALIWYFVAWAVQRRRGVDIAVNFRQVPPD
jgi:amino acid transporter